jgi:hypothetical protein
MLTKKKKKKRSLNKNYKGAIAAALTGNDAGGPPITLGAPKLEGPRGIFPTSLYGQSAPAHLNSIASGTVHDKLNCQVSSM